MKCDSKASVLLCLTLNVFNIFCTDQLIHHVFTTIHLLLKFAAGVHVFVWSDASAFCVECLCLFLCFKI
jgi:hypothetical protein